MNNSNIKLSMTDDDKIEYLKEIGEYHPTNDISYSDVKVCRKDTTCDKLYGCGKKIKRGQIYFRRSFGMKWTWKACSPECAKKLVEASTLWV